MIADLCDGRHVGAARARLGAGADGASGDGHLPRRCAQSVMPPGEI
jgi:hypothetical protein